MIFVFVAFDKSINEKLKDGSGDVLIMRTRSYQSTLHYRAKYNRVSQKTNWLLLGECDDLYGLLDIILNLRNKESGTILNERRLEFDL